MRLIIGILLIIRVSEIVFKRNGVKVRPQVMYVSIVLNCDLRIGNCSEFLEPDIVLG